MRIENPESKKVTTQNDWGEDTRYVVLIPKGLPGSRGVTIILLTNLNFFLEMFTLDNDERYLRPYEILAKLEERVWEDIRRGELETEYLIGYKRDPNNWDGDVFFEFSHFEVNTETEPDENYRSLYIYFEYTGSAS